MFLKINFYLNNNVMELNNIIGKFWIIQLNVEKKILFMERFEKFDWSCVQFLYLIKCIDIGVVFLYILYI